jgi:hypothetical protein
MRSRRTLANGMGGRYQSIIAGVRTTGHGEVRGMPAAVWISRRHRWNAVGPAAVSLSSGCGADPPWSPGKATKGRGGYRPAFASREISLGIAALSPWRTFSRSMQDWNGSDCSQSPPRTKRKGRLRGVYKFAQRQRASRDTFAESAASKAPPPRSPRERHKAAESFLGVLRPGSSSKASRVRFFRAADTGERRPLARSDFGTAT